MLKSVQIFLTDEQYKALKIVAEKDNRSMRSMATILLNRAVREAEVNG